MIWRRCQIWLYLVSIKHSTVKLICKSRHISVPLVPSQPDTNGHISMNSHFHHKPGCAQVLRI